MRVDDFYSTLLPAFSIAMYALYAVLLFRLSNRYKQALARGEPPVGLFPDGYFTSFAMQLVPQTITGFVIDDWFLMLSRLLTLAAVLIVYGRIARAKGTMSRGRFYAWAGLWLFVLIGGLFIWNENDPLQDFVRHWKTVLSWICTIVAFVFLWRGQRLVAAELFRHFAKGRKTMKRLGLSVVRWFSLAPQILYYHHTHSAAPRILTFFLGGFDPILLGAIVSTFGVTLTLLGAGLGYLKGSRSRGLEQA
jgi:hypothetical protein